MKFKQYLLLILLCSPFMVFAQSQVVRNLQEGFPKGSYQYFHESIIRAAANVSAGEEGVQLTKGIRKAVVANIKKLENTDAIYEDIQTWLKVDNYETYLKVTNRGNMANIAGFFMDQLGSLQNKDSTETKENDLSNLGKEIGVFAIDNGSIVSSLCIVIIGESAIQVYEIHGKLELESIPKLIEKVQSFMDIMDGL